MEIQMTSIPITAKRKLDQKESALVLKHTTALLAYRDFCDKARREDTYDDVQFHDLSLGYFLGKGVKDDEAFHLATLCRRALNGFA